MGTLKFKNYEGTAEFDTKRNVYRGKIHFINDVVTYKANSLDSLQQEFEEAVKDYIETCKIVGKEP